MNDRLDQQQDDQIIRYLREQLSADEKAQFEVRMLEEPDLLERMQLLEALTRELEANAADLLADTAAPPPQVLPFRNWIRQPLSLAASVLVGVMAVGTLYQARDNPAPDLTSAAVRTMVLLDNNRSDLQTQVSGPGPYLLQIDVGLDAAAGLFDVVISSEASQQVVVVQNDLVADGNGWVRLLLSGLPGGAYTVAVTGPDAQTRSYGMRFVE